MATQFRRAEQIRRAFFPGRSDVARVDFELSPVSMNESIAQVRLTLDELQLNYSHGRSVQSVYLADPSPGQSAENGGHADRRPDLVRSAEGPWAWFRFMEQGAWCRPRAARVTG
ncbi:type VI secretion IcmF C-terminal domain-containing protein [Pseudomonas sp. PCH446]